MRAKVFIKNNNDKIEFTEKELQTLLDEVYDEGYKDGAARRNYFKYTIPNYGTPITTDRSITTPNYNEKWWTTVSCNNDSSDNSNNVKINGTSFKWPSTSKTSKKE